MEKYSIAVVPGDGIGQEIVPAATEILNEAGQLFDFILDLEYLNWGAGYYLKMGDFMPPDGLEKLKNFDAILFGAVGLPQVDDSLPAKMFTFKVRNAFKQYVNYRPVKLFEGLTSPLRYKNQKDIDFVVIRENNQGEFVQSGKVLEPEAPHGMAVETSIFTRAGIERIAHYAFKLAAKRRKKLTNVTKSNTLIHSLLYWDQVIAEVAQQYPDISYQKMYVDNASANFVLHPEQFDVILTTNMIGDILSDLGGAIMGSLGLGGSGNINPEKDYPSMFEPIHGSAPDIAGQGIANPVGTIWSAALMLHHLGESKAAQAIENAINQAFKQGLRTRDLGGDAGTRETTERLIQLMQVHNQKAHA